MNYGSIAMTLLLVSLTVEFPIVFISFILFVVNNKKKNEKIRKVSKTLYWIGIIPCSVTLLVFYLGYYLKL